MIEEVAERLIAALNANTTAHGGAIPGAVKSATVQTPAAPAKAGRPAAAPKEDKITFEMVKAALIAVKDDKGKPAAVKIIKEVGAANEMNAIKPARFSSVIGACEALMSGGDEPEEEEDDADEI